MTTRILLTMSTALLLRAAGGDSRQFVEVTHVEHVDFPSGGTLRLPNSTGVLTVEGWDRPDVEITTVRTIHDDAAEREKATHDLESHHLTVERRGDEVVITANAPWFNDLEYRVKAPSSAKLIANHNSGEVIVDGMAGDIDVNLHAGDLLLHLPEDGGYDINAKCAIGSINSDYPGQEKRMGWLFGHRIENGNSPGAVHKLNLKVKVGDILILKTRVPKLAS